jgi:hypothetical protein
MADDTDVEFEPQDAIPEFWDSVDEPTSSAPFIQPRAVPAHARPYWPVGLLLGARAASLSWPFLWALLRYSQLTVYDPACTTDCSDPKAAFAHRVFGWLFVYSGASFVGLNALVFLVRRLRARPAPAETPVPLLAKIAVFATVVGVAFAIGVLRGMFISIYGR